MKRADVIRLGVTSRELVGMEKSAFVMRQEIAVVTSVAVQLWLQFSDCTELHCDYNNDNNYQ